MSAVEPLLRIEDLEIGLRDGGTIVHGVNLAVGAGEVLGLVGESGSGKSLTALAIPRLFGANGMSREFVVRGRIMLRTRTGADIDLNMLDDAALDHHRGRDIGIVPQDSLNALNPVQHVGAQILEARRRHISESPAAAREAVLSLLHEAGFNDPAAAAARHAHQLSGGMRQRAMIAMALAAEPRLLIADEPTTALDARVRLQIVRALLALRSRRHLALIFISHDIGIVSHIADRVAVFYCGTVVEQGPAATVLRHPAHPYTAALIASLPRLTRDAPFPRAIPGVPADPRSPPRGCAFHPRCPRSRPGECDVAAPSERAQGAIRMRCVAPLWVAES